MQESGLARLTANPSLHNPFVFQRFRTFFQNSHNVFQNSKNQHFFQNSSNFFQNCLSSSSLFYGTFTPSDRSLPVGSTPKSPIPPQNGVFVCTQARRWPRDGPAETATNYRSHNNIFQKSYQQFSEVVTTIFRSLNNILTRIFRSLNKNFQKS